LNDSRRQELRHHLRDEQPPADGIVLIRGGPNTLEKLAAHARRTHDAFALDGRPLWGVSVFCALDEVGAASLDGLLERFASYRVVHLPRVGELRKAGFGLLPTFGRPHYTVKLDRADRTELSSLLMAMGSGRTNRYHRRRRSGGR
jgi:hypothetical protein